MTWCEAPDLPLPMPEALGSPASFPWFYETRLAVI
jgi:hypothetical protein